MVGMDFFWSLRRSRTNSHLGGVCGALAARWSTDPLLVRIITVLLALSGGVGVVLYGASWLLLPREGETHTPLERRSPRAAAWSRQTWLVIVVVACVLSFATLASTVNAGVLPIIVVGVIWWNRRRRSSGSTSHSNRPDTTPVSASESQRASNAHLTRETAETTEFAGYTPLSDPFRGPDTPFTETARAWQRRVQETRGEFPKEPQPSHNPSGVEPEGYLVDHTFSRSVTTPEPGPAAPRTTAALKSYLASADPVGLYGTERPTDVLEKRRLSRAVPLTAAVLAAAMLGLFFAQLGGLAVTTPLYWGVALLVLGLSCIVNAWRSRAGLRGGRWLAVAAIVASLLAVGANFPAAQPGSASTEFTYSTAESLPAQLKLPSGEATVDLSEMPVTEDRSVTVEMVAGSLHVRLPEAGRVRVIASTKVGELQVLDQQREGMNQSLDVTDGPGEPVLTLNLDLGVGEVRVDR